MKILCVAATKIELHPLIQFLEEDPAFEEIQDLHYRKDGLELEFLITGIGMVPTIYHLTGRVKTTHCDLVLNIGIAGSFREELEIGTVVRVGEDEFADTGVQNGSGFLTMFEAGFWKPDEGPFTNGRLCPHSDSKWLDGLERLPLVKGITVDRVTDIQDTVAERNGKFGADIETMEGAACFYVAMMEGIPVIQLRSVSNRVGEQDRSLWDIPLATSHLADVVISYINMVDS